MHLHVLSHASVYIHHAHAPPHPCPQLLSVCVNQNRLVQPFQLDPVQLDPHIYVTRLVIGWIEIHWMYIVHWIWPMPIWWMRISTNYHSTLPVLVSPISTFRFKRNCVSNKQYFWRVFTQTVCLEPHNHSRYRPKKCDKTPVCTQFFQESTFPTLAHTHAPLHATPDTQIQVRSSRPSNNVQQDMVFAPRKGDRILCINYRELVPPVNWLDVDPPGKANAWNTEVLSVSKNVRTYECNAFNA